MKVCLITVMTPAPQNIRGTSAHPYHILAERDKGIEVDVYTYNFNKFSADEIHEIEKQLNCTMHIVPIPKWFTRIFKYKLAFLRLFLKYPIHNYITLSKTTVSEIKAKKPDIIWVFCAEWSKIVNQFDGFKRIHTLPDSEALYYYRMLGQRFVTHDWKMFWRCAFMYPKFLALERNYSTDPSILYHLVGEEDANFLRRMNPGINARFVRHPHYEVSSKLKIENGKLKINFHQPKIKVLIAGQYNYYMKQEADELLEELKNSRIEELKEHYVFTFLGKGWEKHVEDMKEAGYEVEHITFAPDYIEEISKHDIQITPIAIGTGTKGKVLDALANGLLVIGTPYAMENIAVEHGKSCIVYREPEEVIKILRSLTPNPSPEGEGNFEGDGDYKRNIEKYERIAAEGQRMVLKWHDRAKIANELFKGKVNSHT